MQGQSNQFVVAGRPLPYRGDNSSIDLATITFAENRIEVVLNVLPKNSKSMPCEIWEHTIHELEYISAALRTAAFRAFPPRFEVATPHSQIALVADLSCVVECELGYSLKDPGAQRCTFFCSSAHHGLDDGELYVQLSLAYAGAYGSVVMEPANTLGFADWLDSHLARLRSR